MHMFGVKHTCIGPPKICGFDCLNWFCATASPSTATSIIHCINQCTTQPTGAWWLGYLVPALIVLLFSVPIMFFPQQMPAAKVRRLPIIVQRGSAGGLWGPLGGLGQRRDELYHLTPEKWTPHPQRVLDEKIKAGITTSEEKKEELKKTAKELMHDLVPVMKKLGTFHVPRTDNDIVILRTVMSSGMDLETKLILSV